jgi:conjugal transfer pilus assembly protein TraF
MESVMKSQYSIDNQKWLRWLLISISWKVIVILLWVITVTCFSSSAKADNFWETPAEGWHWYRETEENSTDNEKSGLDPIQKMSVLQEQVKQSLDLAILNPTVDNVRNYITLQNQIGERAQRFSEVWRTVLLNFPELDFSLQHPTNGMAKQIYLDQNHQQEDAAIQKLAAHSGLFFFYRSTCPYCQRFAPIVKDFSQRYHLTVIPITTDGISLPDFPGSRTDQGQAARLKVTMEPALFTVDPQNHRIIPVSYGLLSEDELRQRLLEIAQYHSTSESPS